MRKLGRDRFRSLLSWEHQAPAYASVFKRLLAKRLPKNPATPVIPRQRTAPADENIQAEQG
jgi:hypothetical protein